MSSESAEARTRRQAIEAGPVLVHREQERLDVDGESPAPKAKPKPKSKVKPPAPKRGAS